MKPRQRGRWCRAWLHGQDATMGRLVWGMPTQRTLEMQHTAAAAPDRRCSGAAHLFLVGLCLLGDGPVEIEPRMLRPFDLPVCHPVPGLAVFDDPISLVLSPVAPKPDDLWHVCEHSREALERDQLRAPVSEIEGPLPHQGQLDGRPDVVEDLCDVFRLCLGLSLVLTLGVALQHQLEESPLLPIPGPVEELKWPCPNRRTSNRQRRCRACRGTRRLGPRFHPLGVRVLVPLGL